MKKLKIGIDIDEVLRAKWIQFDRYYVEEFGEGGVPKENPYTHDFFKNYMWEDTVIKNTYLKEPEETPDLINPLDYQTDGDDEAPADFTLFKKEEEKISADKQYKKFMYEDYVLEIHGTAPVMYKGMELHIDKFYKKYKDHADFVIMGKENWFSIAPTLFFLSKSMSRFKEYRFVDDLNEYWSDDIDLIITANPDLIKTKPKGKKHIKLNRPFNGDADNGEIKNILQINDLTDNQIFEKMLNIKNEEDKKPNKNKKEKK